MTLLKLSSNTLPEGNIDSTISCDVPANADLCSDGIANLFQTYVASVSQSTGTMTEVGEFVENLMRQCDAWRKEHLQLKKLSDVIIQECFVDYANVTFFIGV